MWHPLGRLKSMLLLPRWVIFPALVYYMQSVHVDGAEEFVSAVQSMSMLQQIWSKESFQLIVVWGKKDMQLVEKRNICNA